MEDWKRIGRSRRLLALAFALLAIGVVALTRTWWSALLGCSSVLLAWDMAFVAGPPCGTTLSAVYAASRVHGWKTPASHKLVVLLALLLFVASVVLQLRGA